MNTIQYAKRIIIVGGGVAGKEAGTYLGQHTRVPLEILEIEREPSREFGGYGFQSFPESESTNLALRKMYLGDTPDEILSWATNPDNRTSWPLEFQKKTFHPDQPFPRILIKYYVTWRRSRVTNPLVTYQSITGEAIAVSNIDDAYIQVSLSDGRIFQADQLLLATGSPSIKVPAYLQPVAQDPRVIIDPLVINGHRRRALIPKNARVLVLGTGLTGDEQAKILLERGLTSVTMLSREGRRHYAYPLYQKNKPLAFTACPELFFGETTTEQFNNSLDAFYAPYIEQGYSPEDIIEALRPWWSSIREGLGGWEKAADALYRFKRPLATHSIGTSWEVSEVIRIAEQRGHLQIVRASIRSIESTGETLTVNYANTSDGTTRGPESYDFIINAVGRNIIQHPLWNQLLHDGLASKHPGIGVRVNEFGQLIDPKNTVSPRISVIGMARSGDHALRRGYLGNTAFNVPQIRRHCYETTKALLERL